MAASEAHASRAGMAGERDVPALREAIDRVTARNRVERRSDLAAELIDLRNVLGIELCGNGSVPRATTAVPPSAPSRTDYPPEIDASELSVERLTSALADGDCLLVRGLIPGDACERLRDDIDRAFDDRIAVSQGSEQSADDWYKPFELHSTLQYVRDWLFNTGALMAADSPMGFFDLIEALERSGVMKVLTTVFGERPITSVDKTTLRRVHSGQGIEWHQDSAFMGEGYQAVNVWISLSDTVDSPSLEIVRGPLGRIVETGTEGARYDWSVGPGVVDGLGSTHPVVSLTFRPGDAIIFNGMLLHRSEPASPAATRARYATESWFFAAGSFPPQQQMPLAY